MSAMTLTDLARAMIEDHKSEPFFIDKDDFYRLWPEANAAHKERYGLPVVKMEFCKDGMPPHFIWMGRAVMPQLNDGFEAGSTPAHPTPTSSPHTQPPKSRDPQ